MDSGRDGDCLDDTKSRVIVAGTPLESEKNVQKLIHEN